MLRTRIVSPPCPSPFVSVLMTTHYVPRTWQHGSTPVPLSERVITLLRTIQLEQSGRREGWVFPSKKSRSGHIGLSGLEHAFRSVARKLGIPDALKLYCARHTFGTVAMAETRNPGLVKEIMGHESLTTTMGYLHPETAQIKVVIDRLNQQKYLM